MQKIPILTHKITHKKLTLNRKFTTMSTSIHKSTVNFLIDVSNNNNREWFQQNKERYQAALDNFKEFVQELINGISEFDQSIGMVDAGICIYRIYRDVRFSPDKSPYKRHFGAYITPQGKNSPLSGYYIHIQPGNSMVSGGIYMAQNKTMQSIREDISYYADDFLKIIESEPFKNNFELIDSDSLKKLPRGFEPGSKVDEFLKMRHICPCKFYTDQDVTQPNFMANAIEHIKVLHPLANFFNRAINQ